LRTAAGTAGGFAAFFRCRHNDLLQCPFVHVKAASALLLRSWV
jgi:hypothetical protein